MAGAFFVLMASIAGYTAGVSTTPLEFGLSLIVIVLAMGMETSK